MAIGKIKITQEQADAIEYGLKNHDISTFINEHARKLGVLECWITPAYSALNDLPQADLARALLIGYEVEPTFEVGEWIIYAGNGNYPGVHVIERVNKDSVKAHGVEEVHFNFVNIRHATPEEIKIEKERRVWKSIGRDVGEFRKGDVAITLRGLSIRIRSVEAFERSCDTTALKGIHPAESFVSFEECDDK